MPIEIDAKGRGISVVTLNGHATENFLYTQDLLDLADVLTQCSLDKDLRALIVTGKGGTFCGGRVGVKGLTRASEVGDDLNAILKVNNALNAVKVPVIAAIEGQAFGFAFGFTAQSDYAIAAENAVFSLPEMSHGLPPLIVFSYLFRFVSYKQAFELALTSRKIPAGEAKDVGILTEVVPAGTTLQRALEVAENMASFDPRTLSLLRTFGRKAAELHSPELSEHAVAVMSIMLAERAPGH
ncbi:enoyl-CoA hydratase/isomerase family protein [Bosea sp. BK604]|uniref:enoyl-CoA hydratase/isomerase family protein n=1 Tax=Bosea sp. BK604 TaxID=2512180 RepID=UPI001048663E|nr:enoyl-CoA hydratase/isomerase family protein [Bosea sp. BK604]TCR62576.1 methylglutaconyl-CoA hydratase [Bosea sp. BK604]